MDPGTGLTVLGTALGSAQVVGKLLGPTADYLGAGLQAWTERGVKNVARIFQNAERKLGDKLEAPGSVPPKVLKGILGEGPFCDDELAAEYFGGVLASSRSEVGRDDRGATFTALIGRLSTYQIRSHFYFYSMIRILYEGSTENLGVPEGRHHLRIFVPITAYFAAMEFGKGENVSAIVGHVLFGLSREALIEEAFRFGSAEHLRAEYIAADSPGILFAPSALGVELYLWAHGGGDLPLTAILDPTVPLRSATQIRSIPGPRSVHFPAVTFPRSAEGGSA